MSHISLSPQDPPTPTQDKKLTLFISAQLITALLQPNCWINCPLNPIEWGHVIWLYLRQNWVCKLIFNIIQGAKSPLVHCVSIWCSVLSRSARIVPRPSTFIYYKWVEFTFLKSITLEDQGLLWLIERIGHAVSDTEWLCCAHIITPPPYGEAKGFSKSKLLTAHCMHCTVYTRHTAYFVHFANCRLHNIDTRHCNTH